MIKELAEKLLKTIETKDDITESEYELSLALLAYRKNAG